MKIKYLVAQGLTEDESGKERTTYGIDVIVDNVSIRRIPDVFTDKDAACELVFLLNKGRLNPVHIDDVLENVIG